MTYSDPVDHTYFLPYQRRWLEDRSTIRIMEKARQIGMTWTAAWDAVRTTATSQPPRDTWVSSRDLIQAKLFLEDCLHFASPFDQLALRQNLTLLDPADRHRTSSLTFANGARIHSMSSNPDAQAGKRGDRLLDEFALHPDARALYAVAYPGITWGGRLSIISTHRGSHSFFHTLIEQAREEQNRRQISLHRVTLEDALRDGFLERLQSRLPDEDERKNLSHDDYLQYVRDRCPDDASFRQEYLCEPADDDTAFLPYDLITNAEAPWLNPHLPCPVGTLPVYDDSTDTVSLHRNTPWYLGMDLGRTTDGTALWALAPFGDTWVTTRLEVLTNTPFAEQETLLYSLLENPLVRCVAIDQTGLGRQFAERAIERFGDHRVLGVNFSAQSKEQLAWPVRIALESQRLLLPADDTLRADLHRVRRTTSAHGGLLLNANRTAEGHADRFWALSLALHAATRDASSPPFHYTSTQPRLLPTLSKPALPARFHSHRQLLS